MKYACFATVLSTLLVAGTASAQTVPSSAGSAVAPFTWTGFYAGANIGYSRSSTGDIGAASYILGPDVGTYENTWFGTEDRSKHDSLTGGVQFGYNYQAGRFVFGLEADLSALNNKKSYLATSATDLIPYPETRPDYNYHLRETMETKETVDWLGTLRPRIGFTPTERLLVYGTGGLAFARVEGSGGYDWHEYGFWWGAPEGDHNFDRSGAFSGKDSSVRFGWTAGAGLEFAVTDRLTLKGEYLFVDLGSRTYNFINPDDATESVSWKSVAKMSFARVGLNYKF
jgi:outer membrane immunogenic protein